MTQRSRYWSCTKFADWVRGTKKPSSLEWKEWGRWHKNAKAASNFRYWVAETALDSIQNFIHWPLDKLYDAKYYINNRWVTKSHCLTAHPRDIPPGEWRDVGNRFLPCLFNELVDFVEIELAWQQVRWNKESRKEYDVPFWATGMFRIRAWRSKKAGLDNLEWQKNLVWTSDEVGEDSPNLGKPTHQAISAKEIHELYTWWTEVYLNRPDPHDISGWSEYCELRRTEEDGDGLFSEPSSPGLSEKCDLALKSLQEVDERYHKEEEEMMIRLIKVRDSLWT